MLSDELVQKLKKDPAFQEFTEYVVSKIEELDTINGLDNMTNEAAGEEARARGKAKNKLYEILAPVVELKEKRKPSKEQMDEAKRKFAV